jgi:hypothetical protein
LLVIPTKKVRDRPNEISLLVEIVDHLPKGS